MASAAAGAANVGGTEPSLKASAGWHSPPWSAAMPHRGLPCAAVATPTRGTAWPVSTTIPAGPDILILAQRCNRLGILRACRGNTTARTCCVGAASRGAACAAGAADTLSLVGAGSGGGRGPGCGAGCSPSLSPVRSTTALSSDGPPTGNSTDRQLGKVCYSWTA